VLGLALSLELENGTISRADSACGNRLGHSTKIGTPAGGA